MLKIKTSAKSNKPRERSRLHVMLIAALLVCAVAVSVTGFTAARYVFNWSSSSTVSPEGFYFTSNRLVEGEAPELEAYNDFTISLYDYDISNVALISGNEITYSTAIQYYDSADAELGLPVTTQNNVLNSADSVGHSAQLVIPYVEGASYASVQVTSTAPYAKTLGAVINFSVSAQGSEVLYTVANSADGFRLLLMTGDVAPDPITVSWPDGFSPDNTNLLMTSWLNANRVAGETLTSLDANTTYVLDFFGTGDITEVATPSAVAASSITVAEYVAP